MELDFERKLICKLLKLTNSVTHEQKILKIMPMSTRVEGLDEYVSTVGDGLNPSVVCLLELIFWSVFYILLLN